MALATSTVGQKSVLRQLLWPTLFTVVSVAILASLGIWQLHRLAWKEGLLAEIAARADAPVVAPPTIAEWPKLKTIDYDYRHVVLNGRFFYDDTVLVFTPSGPQETGPGYLVLTPLRLDSGAYIIVNRGFVPSALASEFRHKKGPAGEVHVTGLMRPPQGRNAFTPADHPNKGDYFTRDPVVIGRHFQLSPVAPFTVDVDATPGSNGWPRGGTTERDLPNNHFNYALTWFGIAMGLLGVFTSFVFRKFAEAKEAQAG
ncbi:MAG: SURF1 family protein [Beijerinckiaceae bacterium]|nr:MAG: SURF1 family protein [Beijerinckiaceae bacterium]